MLATSAFILAFPFCSWKWNIKASRCPHHVERGRRDRHGWSIARCAFSTTPFSHLHKISFPSRLILRNVSQSVEKRFFARKLRRSHYGSRENLRLHFVIKRWIGGIDVELHESQMLSIHCTSLNIVSWFFNFFSLLSIKFVWRLWANKSANIIKY